jgi:hypothetical protein
MIRGAFALVSVIGTLAIAHVYAQQGPPAAAPARLFGRIVAADTGAPVRSAAVRVAGTNPGAATLVATTDDNGAFDVRDVPPGQYLVHVTKPGFVSTRFSLTTGTADPFGVSGGQQIDMRDLRLPRAGVVSGRVVDGFGDPVADVAVTAWRMDYLTPARRRIVSRASFQTNDLGEFRAHGLEPGKYFISASRSVVALTTGPGSNDPAFTRTGMREAPTFYPGTPNASEAVSIEVQAGQEASGIQFQMIAASYGAVSGVVLNSRGAPYQDAVVWLLAARADDVQVNTVQLLAETDRQGRFRIVNVSPGEYRLEVFSKAFMENIGRTGGPGIGEKPVGEVASQPVTIISGRTEELSVQASTGFTVRGRVFIDGAPAVADVATKLQATAVPTYAGISGQALPAQAGVGADGTFVFGGLHGTRAFNVRGPAGAFLHRILFRGGDVSESGVEVAADTDGVELHLTTKPSRLEGSVRDVSGSAVPAGRVVLFSPDRADWVRPVTRRYQNVSLKTDGTFVSVGLPAGSYLAVLVPESGRDRWADPDYIETLRPFATPFTISDGATTTVSLQARR